MITAEFDRQKLERSLKKYAGIFGDTSAQAVARWGVQTAKEMAFETQVWGKNKNGSKGKNGATQWAKGAQEGAIVGDALKVISIVDRIGRDKKGLASPEAVNEWIDKNRTRRNRRTATLPISERRICTDVVFKKAMKIRFKKAGMAKGGWIGAAQESASHQTGSDKISVGKNFMSWTQKHAHFGSATKPQKSFSPHSKISNSVQHTASSWVMKKSAQSKAIEWGIKKTITWYRKTLRAIDKNQKP